MKVTIVREFNSQSEIREAIETIQRLKQNHIKADGCKEPDRCDTMHQLDHIETTYELALIKWDKVEAALVCGDEPREEHDALFDEYLELKRAAEARRAAWAATAAAKKAAKKAAEDAGKKGGKK